MNSLNELKRFASLGLTTAPTGPDGEEMERRSKHVGGGGTGGTRDTGLNRETRLPVVADVSVV